ncbi:MAG: PAS domain S-box protein, partial [candidate division WOR-3 bacterium]|nr:PAS domain S-box protein [candidate division WOR-3 bacterium]
MVRLEIAMDVTKRKRAEEALERERKAFRIIAEAAANAKDIPDLCQRVLEGFVDIMGFDSGSVRLYDEGKRILEAVAVTDMNEAKARSKPSPRSIDNLTHIPSIVARTRQAIFAPDVRGHEILKTHKQRLEELGIRSLITWPILGAGDRLLGVMHLVAGTPKEIPESHRVFFQTVAEMFATVLEHKRAEQGIKRHSRELSTLLEVSTEVSATLDEEEVTRLIAKRATELIGADGCTIYRFDPQTEELVPKTTTVLHDREKRLSCRLPLGEGITGKAALERRPILANNVHLDDSAIRIPGVEETPRCLLVAPLVAHGELWGVMTLVRLSEEGFREHDLDLFALFANQVADAAVNSSLFSRLSESEEKYRSFVEQAIDGIVIIQDGRIVFANRAAADFGGYALDELIGMEFHHAAALGSREDMLNRYRRRVAGEQVPSVYETKLLARDGRMLDAELNAGIIQYQGRPAVLVFIRDIAERKRAEGALRESERRYRLLAQNVTDVIWTMNMELRFTYLSPSVESLLGYSVEEAMSLTMEEILTPVSFGLAEKIFAEEVAIEGMEQRDLKRSRILELEFNCKDGSRVWIEVKVGFLRDRDSQAVGILGVARDITERKRAEEALRESEEKYRNLVERANDGITIIQDTLLKYVNPRLPHLLGYSVEEMLNTPFTAYIDPEELPKVNERYRRRMAGEDVPSIYETIIRHKNGSKIYVEFNAGIVTYQGKPADLVFVRYITERKMVEEALRESEELYRTLVNSAEEGICLVDSDERFLFVNPKMANLVGYDQEELMRKSLLELVPSDEVEFIRSESRRRMKGETSRYETTFIHKNGTPRKVLVNAAPIYDADGEFYAALGVLTDITDLKIVEDELRLRLIYQTAFAQIMNRAIVIENLDTFIQACLEILGNALDVNRVCLATNREVSKQREGVHPSAQEEPGAHVTHEWLGHGIKTLLGSEYPYSRIGYIHKRLKDDEITASLVSSLPEPDSRVFRDQGALSVIAAPIYLRSGFYGFIGVEECRVERRWRESEIEAFRTAVRLIVTVIDRYFEQQERRVAEEARARSEQRYRTLVETSSDIIFLLSPSGKPLYGSPSVEKMGYKREDILREPKAFLKAIAPDDVVMLEALFAKALREGKPAHDIDCEIYDSQGRSHWFAVSWNFIRDDGGRIIAVQGVARDITERKQAERALRLRMEYEKV